MTLFEDFEEELKVAKEKCKNHFEEYPRGFITKFIKGISGYVQKIKEGDRKTLDFEVLLYNLKIDSQNHINQLNKIMERIERENKMKPENEKILKKLEELHNKGMLTDKGFNTAKERLEDDQEKGVINDDVV